MKRKKLLPKVHTAKLVHRHNTSYGLLLVVLALVFVPLLSISVSVAALPDDPVTTSNGVYAVIAAPVPTTAPVIKSIVSGQIFTVAELVPISGSCPKDTVIKIFKNQIMAGSALCSSESFSLKIDLFIGSNTIITRAYNSNNIPGPDSIPINVILNPSNLPLASLIASGGQANQFFVTSDTYYQGVRTGDSIKWPITLAGGQAPYAVSIGWGDGKTDLISRTQSGTFDVEHVYSKVGDGYRGSYNVTILATDQSGVKSFVQFVAIVNDPSGGAITAAKAGYNGSRLIRTAWQLFIGCIAIIAIFWLGEKYEVRIMKKKYKLA